MFLNRVALAVPILVGLVFGNPLVSRQQDVGGFCAVESNKCLNGDGILGDCTNGDVMQMKTSNALATALLVALSVSCWDVEKRCEDLPDLCFLSFIWCDSKDPGHCSLPPEVYPESIRSDAQFPIILSDTNYTIKWLAKQNSDEPVTFTWVIRNVTWETNVTGTEFVFNANDIIYSFPTEQHPNISPADAWFEASGSPENWFSIARANKPRDANGIVESDSSQQFMVEPSGLKDYLRTQRQIEYNKWKLPVGLSVGLGVPFLLAITALVTWLICKRTMKKPEEKPIEMNLQ
ncbi:hypothetical protein GGR51DRAFT_575241 [Nemania sp. FL0031]|nr:hypothetical protein GGR51DRAFT_575241 [Nemania sp. FL0031]